jgi:DNA-binding NtrC family response regulator
VKGAFTGADRDREGLMVAARGGTLFLDELGELPMSMQAKLLRVLQEREVRPVGGTALIGVDFRLVCATNRDLRAEVAAGRFREDLYYRIGVVEIALPPLRDRLEDIPELARHIVARAAKEVARPIPRVGTPTLRKLTRHRWPGNVRELENVLTKAVVLSEGAELRPVDVELPEGAAAPRASRKGIPAPTSRSVKEEIVAALEATGWNAVRAAKSLGMPRATFYRRLEALGIERP